uniref:DUF3778 domain-containing protein n=1 Tax=Oryza punctata TaxID=4537 RepID=A0A0E0KHN0_ORYPU
MVGGSGCPRQMLSVANSSPLESWMVLADGRFHWQGGFAGFVVRIELKLLKFNDELRGQLLLSPGMLTPKSMVQQQTFNLCRYRGGNRRGSLVCQALCTSKEARGCNRRERKKKSHGAKQHVSMTTDPNIKARRNYQWPPPFCCG